MKGLRLENGRLHYRHNCPQPVPEPHEALIKVSLAGICATDLEMVRGYVPDFSGVLGHEFVGVVASAADAAWVGRRVVASINVGCNACDVCRRQGPEHCPERTVLGIHRRDGAFAEYVAMPLANLYAVPDAVADEAAVFTEPLAAALHIRDQIKIVPSARIAVLGAGRLGMLIGQVLRLAATEVTFIGRQPASLALPDQLGFGTVLVDALPNDSFDLVVEATGNSAGLEQALRLVRPLGTLVCKSTFTGSSHLNLTKLVVDEITVVGSRCGPFAPALRLLAQEAIAIQPLIDGQYALEDAVAAFAHAARSGVRKILLRP